MPSVGTRDQKKWRFLWMDQRKVSQFLINGSIVVGIISWLLVSVAIAQSVPERADAPIRTSDLVRFQWWAIAGLMGLVQVLIGFIVVRDMNSTKANVRELWEKKMDKEEHEKIDHSVLCPTCRNAAAPRL